MTLPDSPKLSPLAPVTQSIIAPEYLSAQVLPEYPIGQITSCILTSHSFNDSYLVEAANGWYTLRVYRYGRKAGVEDIHFELELLRYVRGKGAAVAAPILRADGAWLTPVDAPEGRRYAALFEQAQGVPTAPEDIDMQAYGRAAAIFHSTATDFYYRYQRPSMTLAEQIDKPLAELAVLLKHRPDDYQYLQRMANRAHRSLHVLQGQLEEGICHNDLHGGNAYIDKRGNVTLFDFDECCHGWRAYEIAVVLWSERRNTTSTTLYPAFLEGYREKRRLNSVDLRAVPYFVIARHFWWLGAHITHAGWFGNANLTDRFWTRAVEFLQAWESELK
jgi:Ser/Thr protein kinase RdoA (MazF antagonist)